ncbi:DDT domain-containing protein DDB_G0282237 isoform X1 [Herrania umbratica]|uniref:DDT domain-containing protein DDB_G0282237 isoform X1 n=1 Tax=Herrania umbratica TaxID=108875 RepID=A0A6J0ZF56_9ROSI|nr:DDT domain-containing protein DDB_G0282237 isoform X1 [Herrania umbratica]XP_021273589.1 DDT domain-containing protein DDB_G0282237 isoform X1 [Herrania umbratica]
MPLFKRKPFGLAEPPKDLEPYALVYQVRFTKEIFQDYQEYLNRINFYRQRVWMCKYTGKSNMTYEEALVSEKHATQKVQELPNELVAPALCIIQFSMLSLRDLADAIAKKLQKDLFVGANLYGRKDGSLYPCKVLKLVENGVEKIQYEVAWINKTRKITENSIVLGEDLVWKKTPFSRNILKSFIRESTCRSIPWVIHEKLAQKHGISTDPPQELRSRFFFKDGQLVAKMKKRKNGDGKNVGEVNDESGKSKRKKVETGTSDAVKNGKEENNQPKEEPVKYPIDDLLVQPGPDDPLFTDRPFPSRDFNVPMDCVGDLLMVWDFCSSFSRLLHLWPFSLEDFENAICHKDSNLVLIAETHSALLRLLIKDDSEYSFALQKRKRKPKISLITWTDYVCDFLEMINITELSSSMTTIKRGHYGLLDANAKLWVLRELVSHALETDLIRGKLDEHIEQRQMLGAIRRGEALEYARKRREEKEQLKGESGADGLVKENSLESTGSNPHIAENGNPIIETGDMVEEVISSQQSNTFYDRRQLDCPSMKTEEKQNVDPKVLAENVTNSCEKEAQKQLSGDKKEAEERKSKEKRQQRREYFEREMEKRSIRTSPLGKDRDYNRYWWFRRDGRIFIEISDTKQWGYYSTKEEVDALIRSLNRKGERERALQIQLEKFYGKICLELQKRSKDLAHKIALEEAVLRRSTRVRAPPRENPANAFLRYVNKWKED